MLTRHASDVLSVVTPLSLIGFVEFLCLEFFAEARKELNQVYTHLARLNLLLNLLAKTYPDIVLHNLGCGARSFAYAATPSTRASSSTRAKPNTRASP